jgi:hypothetical protein
MGLITMATAVAFEIAKLGVGDFSYVDEFGQKMTVLVTIPNRNFHVSIPCIYYSDAVTYHRCS